jgi:hypothetical protein
MLGHHPLHPLLHLLLKAAFAESSHTRALDLLHHLVVLLLNALDVGVQVVQLCPHVLELQLLLSCTQLLRLLLQHLLDQSPRILSRQLKIFALPNDCKTCYWSRFYSF